MTLASPARPGRPFTAETTLTLQFPGFIPPHSPPVIPRLVLLLPLTLLPATGGAVPPTRPNLVLIVCDNLGNGDLGCFGATLHRTPHADRLAAEGTKFTGFHVASGVCPPAARRF